MKRSQLNAISYSIQKRENAKREKFIIEKEGSLDEFNKSRYKSLIWYIKAKTIHNCDTCEVSRICGKHEFGGCTKCSFYVEVIHNNAKFGKACLCTFCRSRKGKPEWRQDKTL